MKNGFKNEDYDLLLKYHQNPEITGYLRRSKLLVNFKTKEEVKNYFLQDIKNKHTQFFGIYDKSTKQIIGYVLLANCKKKKGEFGIVIGDKSYWGKGIGMESSILFINYLFYNLGLEKVYLHTSELNSKAQKLFKKLGFQKIGLKEKDRISYHLGKWAETGSLDMELSKKDYKML